MEKSYLLNGNKMIEQTSRSSWGRVTRLYQIIRTKNDKVSINKGDESSEDKDQNERNKVFLQTTENEIKSLSKSLKIFNQRLQAKNSFVSQKKGYHLPFRLSDLLTFYRFPSF